MPLCRCKQRDFGNALRWISRDALQHHEPLSQHSFHAIGLKQIRAVFEYCDRTVPARYHGQTEFKFSCPSTDRPRRRLESPKGQSGFWKILEREDRLKKR